MIQYKQILMTLALLITAVTGVWADEEKYTVTLSSEFTSVPSIYAGVQNYFTAKVTNQSENAGTNVTVKLYLGEELIETKDVASIPAGETTTLNFTDPTIRPVTEKTIVGNNNENAIYKVVVEEETVVKAQIDFSFVIVYNGNLSKDYAYPSANPTNRTFSFTGDVKVLTQEESTYMSSGTDTRDDVFTVALGEDESVYKALLYVSYNWENPNNNKFTTSTTTFNGTSISSIASYRDQSNLGSYGSYGYGLVVYDVTDYVVSGDNTFSLDKTGTNVAVYPSSLIVMVNNPSSTPKTIYIAEEADLLNTINNKNVVAVSTSTFKGVTGTEPNLYVFAATAQAGEGDLIINNVSNANVWKGTTKSLEVFKATVDPGDITVQFKATGSSILALHQMIIAEGGDSDVKVTTNAEEGETTFTEASFTMPGYDVNVNYELIRDMTVAVSAKVGDGTDGCRFSIYKKEGGTYDLVDKAADYPVIMDNIDAKNPAEVAAKDYELQLQKLGDDGKTWANTTDYSPGTFRLMVTGKEGYDGTIYTNTYVLYEQTSITFAKGYSTHYYTESLVLDEKQDGLKFYAVTAVTDEKVTLTEIEAKAIPAETPFIAYNAGAEAVTAKMGLLKADDVTTAEEFKGTAEDKTMAAQSGCYVLRNGDTTPAFRLVEGAGTLPAHRCWIELGTAAGTRSLGFDFSDATGMSEALRAKSEESAGDWYDLQGRKLQGAPLRKGAYIHNGKTIIIK